MKVKNKCSTFLSKNNVVIAKNDSILTGNNVVIAKNDSILTGNDTVLTTKEKISNIQWGSMVPIRLSLA
jgi:archaeosine-15-forming tRNA-guanine transglycosylase